jgi:L-alanine-DL-glutamate epimerase-like enolase superfamily enzyme
MGYVGRSVRRREDERLVQGAGCFVGEDVNPLGMLLRAVRQHAHLVAALPRCRFGVESHSDTTRNPLSHHLLIGGPETRDSFVHLNDKPGFGVEIDWDYAKRYAA